MSVIRSAERRRTQTPNAVMTTLASPTQGGAAQSLWQVEMSAGQAGPPHVFDAEQVWTVLDGAATVELDGTGHELATGDTVVIPAGRPRQVRTDRGADFVAIVTARGDAKVYVLPDASGPRSTPPWIA